MSDNSNIENQNDKSLFELGNHNNSVYVKELLINKKYDLLKKLHKVTESRSDDESNRSSAEDFLNLKISQLDKLINYLDQKKK